MKLKLDKKPIIAGVGALVLLAAAPGVVAFFSRPDAHAAATSLKANGTVEADEIEIGAQRPARLRQYLVAEGQPVKQGEIIATLDTSELTAQLTQVQGQAASAGARLQELLNGARPEELRAASGQVAQARASISGAERTLNNAKRGFDRRTTLKQALDGAVAQRDIAAAAVEQAKAALEGAEQSLKVAQEENDSTVALRTQRDGAKQALDAAVAAERSARAQLLQARNGPRKEEIQAAEAALGQAIEAVNGARQEMDNAASDLKRARELHAGNALSDQGLDAAVVRADTSRSRFGQAEKTRAQSEARLAELKLGTRPEVVDAAEAGLQLASANVTGTRRTLENAEESLRRKLGSRGELEGARAQRLIARAQVTSAEAALAGAELSVRNTRTAYEDALGEKQSVDSALQQYQSALAQMEVAQAGFDQLRNGARREQVDQARAQLAQARGLLSLAQVQMDQGTIRAPRDGVITEHVALVGEVLTPGATVAKLVPLNEAYLVLYTPLTELGKVKIGQTVDVTTDTYANKTYRGKVSEISETPEFTPRNVQTRDERVKLVFQVKVTVDNHEQELKPGMPADALIHLQ